MKYAKKSAAKTKKVYKPKKKSLVVNRSVGTLGLGFPKKIQMTHRYVESTNVNSSSGAFSTYFFSCNGMYDPNITGTGHQPMYFDQMTALYDHYTVIGSKCTFQFIPTSSTVGAVAVGGLINDDTSTTATSFPTMMENSLVKPKYINFSSSLPTIITLKWSAKKFFGKGTLANSEMRGTSASNPTEQSYFQAYVQSIDGITTNNITVQVCIEYIAIWNELKDISAS